ncbi:Armadillo-like helical [Metarhizium album ARSEF 1941]|uniref:Armadillo-like helical n=1 Tax=Metarhizium album (strain ARSEF 1941) TaxID=1081103 RepID=A0A0B2WM33_METAS|nr:Armadillo-like helical [Metarhizium album ARSEF 1941]KHN95008.1 Armadillo-like helical [Metarhizium album ARSEF 1941]
MSEVKNGVEEQPEQIGQHHEQHQTRDTRSDQWHLAMTQADKMHKAGLTGNEVFMGVQSTAVDYTHDAKGGCFGPGYRVSFGDNLAKDGKKGGPVNCTWSGTSVAGILAVFSISSNYIGVAPNVFLGTAEDAANIITLSIGAPTQWPQHLLAQAVSWIAASGIATVENSFAGGQSNFSIPSAGRGVTSISTFSQDFVGDNYASYGPTWELAASRWSGIRISTLMFLTKRLNTSEYGGVKNLQIHGEKIIRLVKPQSRQPLLHRESHTRRFEIMADQEEDFSSLPLNDRFSHKVWKVRKAAYEDAAKQFSVSPDETDPCFRPFLNDPNLWKSAVTDSNVAAQQEALAALCAFLKFGGRDCALRTRGLTITPMVEKCLSSTRAATKQNAQEALLLYIELDTAGPVVEDVLPGLANKVPKNVAATLNALTAIFHNFGCKIVDPKPVLKTLPKVFGAADKNVRAEATNLTVELYRWLREAMKPMFWGDLKPTQQTDLEAQFDKIKAEPPPKQERLLRSQQAAAESAPAGIDDGEGGAEDGEEAAEVDVFSLAEPEDITKKISADFSDMLASSKWKDRKEAVEALYQAVNVPRIKDSDFAEVNRGLAKCMKDANVAVVTQAAQCIEQLARGLRQGYGKYRAVVMQPIMDRLKEKKASVSDALGAALDAVFVSTSLTDCLEDITTYLSNKNPQVKEGTMKFLIRCLRTTRTVPAKPEIAAICESGKKLLSEGSPALRDGGAEILGTVMKILGERAMTPYLDGLDDIRKTKVKEFFETAEVKAKEKPKPAPAAKVPPPSAKKPLGAKRPVVKKVGAPVMPAEAPTAPAPAGSKPAVAGSKLGGPKPSGLAALKAPQKRTLGGPGALSPRRPAAGPPATPPVMPPDDEPVAPPPQPRAALSRGLAGRSLAKPTAASIMPAADSPPPASGLTAAERAELEELRAANERLSRQVDDMRQERNKFMSEIQELKNQNAGLIEDHTRDVLSVKAKETQLVRARSDAEATGQANERLRRELERLKRALSLAEGLGAQPGMGSPVTSPTHDDVGIYRDSGSMSTGRNRMSFTSTVSEEKENGELSYPRNKLSPELRRSGSGASSGRGSPARGLRSTAPSAYESLEPTASATRERPVSTLPQPTNGGGVESWRRAAEVTSQLKARIEQMKASEAKQGFSRP